MQDPEFQDSIRQIVDKASLTFCAIYAIGKLRVNARSTAPRAICLRTPGRQTE